MVMKRLSLVSILFLFASFVSGTVASEDLDQEEWWLDAEEITEQDAEEETSEEESEQTAPEAEVAPPQSDVKYVIERQLKDTGLIFLPYGPGEDSLGEIRPSESYYQGVPQMRPRVPQVQPMVFIEDKKKEGTEQEEGGEENEEGENEDDETNNY